jgi:phage terminase large subunit-like protein
MRSQHAIFKEEEKMQQQTLNSWLEVVWKKEQPPPLTVVEGVVQTKLNEEHIS